MRPCIALLMLCLGALTGCHARSKPHNFSELLSNPRLKSEKFADEPIDDPQIMVVASGMWMPVSDDPGKSIAFPEQAEIVCTQNDMICRANTVSLGALPDEVQIMDLDTDEYRIDSWDSHVLHASYGPDTRAKEGSSDKCHHHVLVITFESGLVLLSDVPTGEKGCETFKETNTYRLTRGHYYIDTSAKNDLDKPE